MRKSIVQVLFMLIALLLAGCSSSAADPHEGCPHNLKKAVAAFQWNERADPAHIAGPVWFVGTKGLGMWLIKTTEGCILMNTGLESSGPMIEQSIRKLGIDPKEIKILLACHAHVDHVGAHAYIQKLSCAKVWMIEQEKELIESGGSADFKYGKSFLTRYPRVTVDRVFRDGDKIKLGEVTLTAFLTPGHSRGSTTFVMKFSEKGKIYTIVFPDGTGVNPGYRLRKTLFRNPSYPTIAEDYRRTFSVLQRLKPDIWLAPHLDLFNFDAKLLQAQKKGLRAWIDPQGYHAWVRSEHRQFEEKLGR